MIKFKLIFLMFFVFLSLDSTNCVANVNVNDLPTIIVTEDIAPLCINLLCYNAPLQKYENYNGKCYLCMNCGMKYNVHIDKKPTYVFDPELGRIVEMAHSNNSVIRKLEKFAVPTLLIAAAFIWKYKNTIKRLFIK